MRILYIDIDSLRPDHLGCYGYHRNTSPNIDSIAEQGVRFENVYVTDAPCLPSRTALWSGRYGFHTGVVGHGGTAGDPIVEGPERGFRDLFGNDGWMTALRRAGYRTATVSSFGERHAAWHWYAGYNEIHNPGYGGMDRAEQVTPIALNWLERNGQNDNWFLHINLWDPHTPFRTPESYGNPFADEPLPDWLTEDVWRAGWEGFGPHSPQEPNGHGGETPQAQFPRHPDSIDSMAAVRAWVDGYDTGIRYSDDHIGLIFAKLREMGIMDEVAIIISADHGENIGELNVWGDHQTADKITCNVPLIVRWPGVTAGARVDNALHYHFDFAATVIELVGGSVPDSWDGQPFSEAFKTGADSGREYLVTSQGAWACQRGVRFQQGDDAYLYLQTYHDGHKMLDPAMLFNLTEDPYERHNLRVEQPEIAHKGAALLAEWLWNAMQTSRYDVDPLMTVMREGGPFHTRGRLPTYIERLKTTGRTQHAETLAARHPDELR